MLGSDRLRWGVDGDRTLNSSEELLLPDDTIFERYDHITMVETRGFTEELLSSLVFPTAQSEIVNLSGWTLGNGFRLSSGNSSEAGRIRLCCNRASPGQGGKHAAKTGSQMTVQSLRQWDMYRVQRRREQTHNHEMPTLSDIALRHDAEETAKDMIRIHVEKSDAIDCAELRIAS
jgi:hypothetical protein